LADIFATEPYKLYSQWEGGIFGGGGEAKGRKYPFLQGNSSPDNVLLFHVTSIR